MSKDKILSLISRMEQLADMMPDCSERELNSIGGQILGTATAIVSEFDRHGINCRDGSIADSASHFASTCDVDEAVYTFHRAAGYWRGLAELL